MTAVRAMLPEDWKQVEAIYIEGIATGHATFEAEPPTWEEFDAGKLDVGRLVAVDGDRILGWTALSPVSARPVYCGVVEHSVYIAVTAHGQGLGTLLLDALLTATDDAGLWTIQSSIFPENIASLALHDRAGFRRVGTRNRIAYMTYGPAAGSWRDTILIERRSPAVP
ncbi:MULTISPECIES: GNAT family N-acetyltransferase [Microbacterium]|uniref:GNAT family N-acetyltransferase n=1 Tax=Microbacterium TaxID=33882 RepID=UPI002788DB88|nr:MULTISPECIES: GNAT family N-acetyltransferase [Microbacterium]MDQ1082673.1 L-amino acid N-acyltransferase YncA [Microbacterium sp. SORGH_AS_0344]MDQ1168556.1 L-amino acid N-acyltransferase YncA [Microbacterium proteolyticum]